VRLGERPAVHGRRAHAAVERALGSGVTPLRPAVDVARVGEHGVLLLEAVERGLGDDLTGRERGGGKEKEKRRQGRGGAEGERRKRREPSEKTPIEQKGFGGKKKTHRGVDERRQRRPRVRRVRRRVRVEHLAHHQHVLPAAHGVRVDRDRVEDAVRVVALSLPRRRAVEGPVGEVLGVAAGHGLLDDLGLGAHLVEDGALRFWFGGVRRGFFFLFLFERARVGIFGPLFFFFPVFFPLSLSKGKRGEKNEKTKQRTFSGAPSSPSNQMYSARWARALMRTTAARRACGVFGSGERERHGGRGGAEVVSDEGPGRLFERHRARSRSRRRDPSFFCPSLFGPQCARSARANRHWRAADGTLEREIGTGCIQELKKCLETAALGKGKYKSKDCLFFFRFDRARSREEGPSKRSSERARGEAARPSILRSPCSLSRESLYPPLSTPWTPSMYRKRSIVPKERPCAGRRRRPVLEMSKKEKGTRSSSRRSELLRESPKIHRRKRKKQASLQSLSGARDPIMCFADDAQRRKRAAPRRWGIESSAEGAQKGT
jgi:hypothetical protein